jgi:hypothetical protein
MSDTYGNGTKIYVALHLVLEQVSGPDIPHAEVAKDLARRVDGAIVSAFVDDRIARAKVREVEAGHWR